MKTINEIFEDTCYNMVCTYIVRCMNEEEIYTRETKGTLLRHWGLEEAIVQWINTREIIINIQ